MHILQHEIELTEQGELMNLANPFQMGVTAIITSPFLNTICISWE